MNFMIGEPHPEETAMRRVALFSLIALTLAACNKGPTALDSSSPRQLMGAGAHFQENPSPCSILNSGALRCHIDEAGLGNGDVNYTLTADFEALFACINGGRRNPSAANKRDEQGDVTGGATLEAKNGRARGFISAGPPSSVGFECPPGQTEAFIAVEYSDIVVTDTTSNPDKTNPGAPDPICRDDLSAFSGIASCPAPF
jgi:hypothetical protein